MWQEKLADIIHAKYPVIFCLGNEFRGDDAIGILIGKEIQKLTEIPVILAYNVPLNFVGKLQQIPCSHLLVIDGIDAGMKPGTIGWFNQNDVITSTTTTHMQELDKLIKMLNIHLETLPKVKILGIQINSNRFGDEMSPEMQLPFELIINHFKLHQ